MTENKTKNTPSSSSSGSIQLAKFLAGSLAGSISACVTMPVEVLKTQLQSSLIVTNKSALSIARQIYSTEGFLGFFKGLQPQLIGIFPSRGIYFWTYSFSKDSLQAHFGDTSANHIASAFAAGIASSTITNPIWMIKTRFQLIPDVSKGQQYYSSYRQVIRSIYQESGYAGFYKGLTASYFGCFEGAIHWMIYEKSKQYLAEESSRNLSSIEYFFAAGFSKFVAVLISYPHEVIRTRIREQANNGTFKYSGFLNTFKIIFREEGFRGLYGGIGLHILKSVPNAALMFSSFEILNNLLTTNSEN